MLGGVSADAEDKVGTSFVLLCVGSEKKPFLVLVLVRPMEKTIETEWRYALSPNTRTSLDAKVKTKQQNAAREK